MEIGDIIIKHYLANVLFINGTAYAGKSTMVAMLAERYGLIACGENYHGAISERIATPDRYPNLSYFKTMRDWQEFVNRTPDEFDRWIRETAQEATEFEVAELIRLSGVAGDRKIIVDTNISCDVLARIAEPHQVAIMLSPQSMSVDRFFERDDADKRFVLARIREAEDPERTLANYRACIARVNSQEVYDAFLNSGFYTLVREDPDGDTREEVLAKLARHFGLAA